MAFNLVSLLVSCIFALACVSAKSDIVPIVECQIAVEGNLAANDAAKSQTFSLNVNKEVVFNPSSPATLGVAFEPCLPNFGRFPNNGTGPVAGHLNLISTGNCLGVNNTGGPFIVREMPCSISDDSSQVFVEWIFEEDGSLFWAGATQVDGSTIQGENVPGPANCTGSGFYGYPGTAAGVPRVGDQSLTCRTNPNSFGFMIANY